MCLSGQIFFKEMKSIVGPGPRVLKEPPDSHILGGITSPQWTLNPIIGLSIPNVPHIQTDLMSQINVSFCSKPLNAKSIAV